MTGKGNSQLRGAKYSFSYLSQKHSLLNSLTELYHANKFQVTISQNERSVIAAAVSRFALQSQVHSRVVGTMGLAEITEK